MTKIEFLEKYKFKDFTDAHLRSVVEFYHLIDTTGSYNGFCGRNCLTCPFSAKNNTKGAGCGEPNDNAMMFLSEAELIEISVLLRAVVLDFRDVTEDFWEVN